MPLSGICMISETTSLASSRRCAVLVFSFFAAAKATIVMLNNIGMAIRNRELPPVRFRLADADCYPLLPRPKPLPPSKSKGGQFARHLLLRKGLHLAACEYKRQTSL